MDVAITFVQALRRLFEPSSDNPEDNRENPPLPNPLAPPSGASEDLSIEIRPWEALEADGQDEVAGTSPSPTTEMDVELGEGRIRSRQAAPPTSAPRSDVEGGVTPSRSSMAKLNMVIGLSLLNTSVFPAHSLSHVFYMILTAVGVLVSLFLYYAGERVPTKFQQPLLLVSTMALLGALSMLAVEA